MSYSPQLVYFLDKLSGFSTNVFKLMPNGSTNASRNQITRISGLQPPAQVPAFLLTSRLSLSELRSRPAASSFPRVPIFITH